jgi:hypothetical protein
MKAEATEPSMDDHLCSGPLYYGYQEFRTRRFHAEIGCRSPALTAPASRLSSSEQKKAALSAALIASYHQATF